MNLKYYNPETTKKEAIMKKHPAQITFAANNIISFNLTSVELMDLNDKTKVELIFDMSSRDTIDWYIHKCEDGFELKKLKSGVLKFSSSVLSDAFKLSLGLVTKKTYQCNIGSDFKKVETDGKELVLWPLITRSVKK